MAASTVATVNPAKPARGMSRAPQLSLLTLIVLAGALLIHYGRNLTFFYDEWNFILQRRGENVGTYLDPHNGHLSLFPIVVYKLLFALVGLRHYTPYLLVDIALHLLSSYFLYVFARRRLGPWLALLPTALLLFMGTAWQDLLWAFQIGYLGSIAGGLGALVMLDNRSARSDRLACAALVWSVTSSGVGIPFLIACAVALGVERGSWRRLWVVAVPAVLFGIWYLGWGGGEQITYAAVLGAPEYMASAAGSAVSGMAGVDTSWGPALLILLALVVAASWQRRESGAPTPLLLAAGAGCLSFWLLSAVVRIDNADPTASRYLYVGAVFIWLIVAEARVGTRLSRPWLFLPCLLALGAIVANVNTLRDGSSGLSSTDYSVRASLTSVQVAAPVVSPAFMPAPTGAPQITAGPYLAAVRALGSPALSVAQLQLAREQTREASDQVLVGAEQLALHPGRLSTASPLPATVLAATAGAVSHRGGCVRFVPTGAGATVEIQALPGDTVALDAAPGDSGAIALRRFASDFTATFATLGPGSMLLRLPFDRAPKLPWELQLTTPSSTEICLS